MAKKDEKRLPDGRELDAVMLLALKEEAKGWVRNAMERAELPCGRLCVRLVEDAIREIVQVVKEYLPMGNLRGFLYRYLPLEGQRKVDAIIGELIRKIESYICLYGGKCVDDERKDEEVRAFLGEPYKGDTMEGRVKQNVDRIREKLGVFLAGHPYDQYNDDRSYADYWSALTAMALADVSSALLQRLAETEVSRSWMHIWAQKHQDARYVHVFRGSSYDCDWCDSVVAMGWQEVNGREVIPPIHPNCRCFCIYI